MNFKRLLQLRVQKTTTVTLVSTPDPSVQRTEQLCFHRSIVLKFPELQFAVTSPQSQDLDTVFEITSSPSRTRNERRGSPVALVCVLKQLPSETSQQVTHVRMTMTAAPVCLVRFSGQTSYIYYLTDTTPGVTRPHSDRWDNEGTVSLFTNNKIEPRGTTFPSHGAQEEPG